MTSPNDEGALANLKRAANIIYELLSSFLPATAADNKAVLTTGSATPTSSAKSTPSTRTKLSNAGSLSATRKSAIRKRRGSVVDATLLNRIRTFTSQLLWSKMLYRLYEFGSGRSPGKRKTLVLDLDETLIHSTSRGSRNHDHVVEVLVDKHVCLYYIYKRPFVDLFLRKVGVLRRIEVINLDLGVTKESLGLIF